MFVNDFNSNYKYIKYNNEITNKKYLEIGDIDVITKNYELKDKPPVKGAVLVPKNVILISTVRPNREAITITREELYVSSAFAIVYPNENIDLKYLYYCLNTHSFFSYLTKNSTGATYPTVNKNYVYDYSIPYVSIEKQQEIVSVLDKINSIIDADKKQLELLDETVKSRFIEMFGDPETNEKNWMVDRISSCAKVIGGFAFKSSDFLDKGEVPVLRIGNINSGFFKPVNMVFWNKNLKLSNYEIYPDDLVISLTGTVGKDDYGNVCILDDTYSMYYLNQRNAKIDIVKNINKYYLKQLLSEQSVKSRLTGISRGLRQANIANKDILDLLIPIPPLELQNEFESFVKQINKSKFNIQQHLNLMQELFDKKMEEYFGGNE